MTKESNNSQNENEVLPEELPEVQNELSKVGTNPKQSIAILIFVGLIAVLLFFKFFFYDSNEKDSSSKTSQISVTKPVEESTQKNLPNIPKLPETPKIEIPKDLPPPPPPVQIEKPQQVTTPEVPLPPAPPSDKDQLPYIGNSSIANNLTNSEEEKKRREAKRKSSVILIAGVPPKKTPEQMAEEASFQDRGDMTLTVAKGKIIEAVLETAINSDFGGEVRAIISRDVFSEQDRVVLIPKGSKVFGNYTTGSDGNYGRVAILWNRIDLSNGYTIKLDALLVDNLGRKGEQGRVDNKFKERIANAVLVSAFNIGVAKGLDKIVPPIINSQAAAANTAEAANIQNLAQSINSGTGDENFKIAQICTSVMNAITDKTSAAYTMMVQACNTAQQASIGALAGQRLSALLIAVNNAAASLLTTTATANTPTQAQLASKQAFTDITDTMKSMIEEQEFKPTTTINQGTVVRIYVNKDYKFPKNALRKSRLVK